MRILFFCPNWANLATPIIQEMGRQGHDVLHVDHQELSSFHYTDSLHRILSKFYSALTRKSYKHIRTDEQISFMLKGLFKGSGFFDLVLMTEPNVFNREQIKYIKKHTEYLFVSLWDSLSKSPGNGKNLDLFDKVFSYDSIDCLNNNFKKVNNYFDPSWCNNKNEMDVRYDVLSIMSYTKERYAQAIKFIEANDNLNCRIIFYCDNNRKFSNLKDGRVVKTKALILGEDLKREIESSKAILDLVQGEQRGLSFRVYEAIAYRKKLITNNTFVNGYDMYSKNNIFILSDEMKIDDSFWNAPYLDVAESVYEKYTISSWVRNITDYM